MFELKFWYFGSVFFIKGNYISKFNTVIYYHNVKESFELFKLNMCTNLQYFEKSNQYFIINFFILLINCFFIKIVRNLLTRLFKSNENLNQQNSDNFTGHILI